MKQTSLRTLVAMMATVAACSTGGTGGSGGTFDDDAGVDGSTDDVATPDKPATEDRASPDSATPDVTVDSATPDATVDDAPDSATPDVAVDTGPDVVCPAGRVACAAVCVDTQTDNGNCGACGTTCSGTQTCVAGACVANCSGAQTRCGGVCVNTQSDNANCGACGTACSAGQVCEAGACVVTCAADQTRCGGACVNVQSDGMNCGACGNACPSGQMCAMGACVTTCAAGQALCGAGMGRPGSCVDFTRDSSNCGACGNACAAGLSCVAGACACPTGQALCGGACVNTQTDSANCGACGTACPSAQSCVAGACACPTGLSVCGTACVNTQTDVNACGRCGLSCAAGQMCVAGVCTTPGPSNDACASPLTIDLAAGAAQTITGTTTNATQSANSCTANPDVFYQFTLTQREVVYVDTFGTAWDTVVGLTRPGCSTTATTCVDDSCGLVQSQLSQVLDPGTYVVVVDQYGTGGGAFTLHFQHYPVGGTVASLDLTGGTRRLSGTTSGTSAVSSTCCSGGAENTYYATTCPSFAEVSFRASTCGNATYDTELDFRSGNRAASGGSVCNDDACGLQSTITGRVPAGAGLHVLYADACTGSGAYAIDLQIGDCPAGQSLCGTTCTALTTDRNNCGTCGNVCAAGQACAAGVCRAPTSYTFTTGTATFIDACAIAGRSQQLASVDDVVGTAVNIGFTFPFYGTAYTQVRPTSNGYMLFGGTTATGSIDNAYYPTMALPDASRPFPALFVYNSDLMTGASGVCLATTGTAPNRQFIYEGVGQSYCCSRTGNFTFEAILNERDGSIDFVYPTITFPAGDTHNNVVGLQNNGTTGVTYEYRAGGALTRITSGTSLRITPSF